MRAYLDMKSNPLISDLRLIQTAALKAVDPSMAVKRFLRLNSNENGTPKTIQAGTTSWDLEPVKRVFLIAAGKASIPMARAASEILGSILTQGIVITRHGQGQAAGLPNSIQVFESGHPIPDMDGLAAAEQVEALLAATTSTDRLIVLISGGASALLPFPAAPISLEEMQAFTALLLASGAAIHELNTIRKHLDRLKGGQMARAAAPTPLAALILSDVVGDPLDVIASGPTVADPSTFQDARDILDKYHLFEQIPAPISAHFLSGIRGEIPDTPKPNDPLFKNVSNTIIGSNRLAAEAAVQEASRLGYQSMLLSTFIEGEAREAGKFAAALIKGIRYHETPFSPPACIVWGGETTVTIRGSGKGGRNQELALSAALGMQGTDPVALMALATDGVDGPTDAAGAIVTGDTILQAKNTGLDAFQFLSQNDSYNFFKVTGELIMTGPTGTNVNDLLVLLVGPGAKRPEVLF
jgi:glycerate 2-kinase